MNVKISILRNRTRKRMALALKNKERDKNPRLYDVGVKLITNWSD